MAEFPDELLRVQDADTELSIKAELDKNPENFDLWMKYIRNIEAQGNVKKTERCYDELLAIFPLLYGYWCKNAKLDYDDLARSRRVYERALKLLPYCIELWTDYCAYVADKSLNINQVRSLFERATSRIGSDYSAGKIWRQYVDFEMSQESFPNVSKLYLRIFVQPLEDLQTFWDSYVEFAANRASVSDLCTDHAEYVNLQAQASTSDEQKEIVVRWRQKKLEEGVHKRELFESFEQHFTRPFFHPMRPLDRLELHNWRRYLVYLDRLYSDSKKEEGEGGTGSGGSRSGGSGSGSGSEGEELAGIFRRVVSVYERCLVPCANYIEFYKRYAMFYARNGLVDRAREILNRAVNVYLKSRPESHVALAEFEEAQGNGEKSLEILQQLLAHPKMGVGCVHSAMALIQFYCRHGRLDEAEQVFVSQGPKIQRSGRDFFDVQFAYFVRKFRADPSRARELYTQAVVNSPGSRFARMAQIHFELEHGDVGDSLLDEEGEEEGEGSVKKEEEEEQEEEDEKEEEEEVQEEVHPDRRKKPKVDILDLFEEAVSAPQVAIRDRVDLFERYRDYAVMHVDMKRILGIDERRLLAVVEENEEDRQKRLSRKRKAGEHPDAPNAKKPKLDVAASQDLIGKFGYNPTL